MPGAPLPLLLTADAIFFLQFYSDKRTFLPPSSNVFIKHDVKYWGTVVEKAQIIKDNGLTAASLTEK